MCGQPSADGLACGGVEANLEVIEPVWQVANESVLVLDLGADLVRNDLFFRARKLRLQIARAVEQSLDVALRIEKEARPIVGRNGAELLEELQDVAGVRLADAWAGQILE